jgi:hypothetical protein
MIEETLWDRIRDWFGYLPIRLAYRIIWLAARLNMGSARCVYRAMWNANLDLPPLPSRFTPNEGEIG